MADNDSIFLSSSDDSSDDETTLAIAAVATAIVIRGQQQKRKKLCWSHEWPRKRAKTGAYECLLQELHSGDLRTEKNFLRMSHASFLKLLQCIGHHIEKKDTVMRQAIKPEDRLAITLRYLGSGSSLRDLKCMFHTSDSTIRSIVLETCKALYSQLKARYLEIPRSPEKWKKISQEFEERWDLPHCIGAICGKHIQIIPPASSDSSFMSGIHPGSYSICLLGLVDAHYKFLHAEVSADPRSGDNRVFQDSPLVEGLRNNSLGLPDPVPLSGREEPMPFFTAGDDTFPLEQYLMKPSLHHPSGRQHGEDDTCPDDEDEKQRIYNLHLSRARLTTENALGIMASRFRVLQQPLRLRPRNAVSIVQACIILHNFLVEEKDRVYAPPTLADREVGVGGDLVPGDWRQNSRMCMWDLCRQPDDVNAEAQRVQNELKEYLSLQNRLPC